MDFELNDTQRIYRTTTYSDTHTQVIVRLSRAMKVFTTEAANQVTSTALQVLGGLEY